MDALLLTSKEWKKPLHKLRIIAAGILLMCVSFALIEYGFYSVKYGLPDGDYPVQSISHFEVDNKSTMLFRGYVYRHAPLFGG